MAKEAVENIGARWRAKVHDGSAPSTGTARPPSPFDHLMQKLREAFEKGYVDSQTKPMLLKEIDDKDVVGGASAFVAEYVWTGVLPKHLLSQTMLAVTEWCAQRGLEVFVWPQRSGRDGEVCAFFVRPAR